MKIFRAIGWGLFFIIIRNVMPEVFEGFRHTLVAMFGAVDKGLEMSQSFNF